MKALALGLLGLVVLAGCATGNTTFSVDGGGIRDIDAGVPPSATPTLTPSPDPQCPDPAAALEPAIADLLWLSESDYPWEYWELPGSYEALPTPTAFLTLIEQEEQPLEVRQLEDYLRFVSTLREDMNDEERAIALRYQNLLQVLTSLYDTVVVYKVGTIEVKVFIVGITCNRVSGIRTLSIET